ncbi:MAG: hypothetical protein M1818_000820 [Claussenomyces sp. TS43310]|nr:MAG: hypothetical protein M1818_000820 [Claussenomyces sp. TS43310]
MESVRREYFPEGRRPLNAPSTTIEASHVEDASNGYGSKRQRIERPRLPLSCLACKKKKIKCDRLLPCNQCKKLAENNKPAHCAYAKSPTSAFPLREAARIEQRGDSAPLLNSSAVPSQPSQYNTPSDSPPAQNGDVVADLQHRVTTIERLLAVQSNASASLCSQVSPPDLLSGRAGILISKKGRIRYAGPGHKFNILSNFQEIRAWMETSQADPTLKAMRSNFRSYQKVFARGQKCAIAQKTIQGSSIESDIFLAIESQSEWQSVVDTYWEHFEKIYRILHAPTFYRTLDSFLKCPEDNRASMFPGFITQLLLVVLIGSSLHGTGSVLSELVTQRPSPQCAIDVAEEWLDRQPRKARDEISFLRTSCLFLHAQLIHQARKEKLWTFSASLVRRAMSMGLHQEPSQFQGLTVFQCEMRRRLWMTIVELDLQISIFSGFPAVVRNGNYNTQIPSNMNDSELLEDMEALKPRPPQEFTGASCQIALAQSLPMRMEALESIQNVKTSPQYRQIVKLGKEMEAFRNELPACLKASSQPDPNENIERTFNLIMLDFHIQAVILMLYLPHALHSLSMPRPPTMYEEAATAHLAASIFILSNLTFFRAPAPAVPTPPSTNHGATKAASAALRFRFYTLYHRLCKPAIMPAALMTSLEIRATLAATNTIIATTTTSTALLTAHVSSTLEHMLVKLPTPDGDLREALILALVLALVSLPASASVSQREACMHDAADMVLAECRKQLGPLPSDQLRPPDAEHRDAYPQLVNGEAGDFHAKPVIDMYDGGAEFMGAEGMDFGSSGFDWDLGLSWI